MRSFCASTALPVKSSARAQKAAVMRRKQNVKLKKIMTKTMFVRRAQRKKMKDKTPIKSSQNAIEILAIVPFCHRYLLTKASVETLSSKTFRGRFGVGGSIRGVGSESRNETATIREPETAKGAEDAGWVTVTEDPFENTADDHEKASHKHVNSAGYHVREFRR